MCSGESECIFATNKEQSLDEPSEIAEDQLDPTTNSYTHSKINKFSEETSSKKKVTENATLMKAKEENDQQKIMGSKADDNGSKHNSRKKPYSRFHQQKLFEG